MNADHQREERDLSYSYTCQFTDSEITLTDIDLFTLKKKQYVSDPILHIIIQKFLEEHSQEQRQDQTEKPVTFGILISD